MTVKQIALHAGTLVPVKQIALHAGTLVPELIQGISCCQPRILQAVSPGNPLKGLFGWLRVLCFNMISYLSNNPFHHTRWHWTWLFALFQSLINFFPNLLGSLNSAGKSPGLYKHVLEFPACFGPPFSRAVSEQQTDNIERDLELESEFPLETL